MDIFARRTTFGGGFNAVSAKVLFAGFRSGLAFETVGVQYQQQLIRLWDLDGDSGNTYLVAGHPSGNASISKAIGPRALGVAFYQRYADVCQAAENNLMLSAAVGCITSTTQNRRTGAVQISLTGVVIAGLGINVSANDPVFRQNMGMTFISLDWNEQGPGA